MQKFNRKMRLIGRIQAKIQVLEQNSHWRLFLYVSISDRYPTVSSVYPTFKDKIAYCILDDCQRRAEHFHT